jgi:predicted metal-binding protein
MAYEHGNCPMDLDEVKLKIEQALGIPVIIGTHYY